MNKQFLLLLLILTPLASQCQLASRGNTSPQTSTIQFLWKSDPLQYQQAEAYVFDQINDEWKNKDETFSRFSSYNVLHFLMDGVKYYALLRNYNAGYGQRSTEFMVFNSVEFDYFHNGVTCKSPNYFRVASTRYFGVWSSTSKKTLQERIQIVMKKEKSFGRTRVGEQVKICLFPYYTTNVNGNCVFRFLRFEYDQTTSQLDQMYYQVPTQLFADMFFQN